MLVWFQAQLCTQDPVRIAKARRTASRFFRQTEARLSDEEWPDDSAEWPDGNAPEAEP